MMLLLIKNVVTKIMNNYTGLQRIELNGFAKHHLENWLLHLCIWLVFRPVLRPRLVPVVYRFGVLTIPLLKMIPLVQGVLPIQ